MASDYTANVGLANPAPGDCNWDNDWHRNQYISDICLGVLNSTNRIISGGLVSLTGGLGVTVSAGSANVAGVIVSWVDTPFTIDAAAPELEYESNWFSVDETGTITRAVAVPSGDSFVALAVVDVDDTAILRSYDLRALQTDASVIPAVEKVLSGTGIVQAFLYDTALDVDLGLWIEKTAWTSWYNEALNTATRGATRKFPKRVLIVAETDKVTIYDAVNPSLPMWMVFTTGTTNMLRIIGLVSSLAMLSGVMVVGGENAADGIDIVNFKSGAGELKITGNNYLYLGTIAGRNDGSGYVVSGSLGIISQVINAVSMTTLTGNDYPTIAVATDGGVSVIDGPAGVGTVVDITNTGGSPQSLIVAIIEEALWFSFDQGDRSRYVHVRNSIPSADVVYTGAGYLKGSSDRLYANTSSGGADLHLLLGDTSKVSSGSVGNEAGLTLLKEDTTTPANGMANYITDTYQSGWMQGDIKLATLADTTAETIGLDITTEHVVNGTFDTDISGWTDVSSGTGGISWNASGYLQLDGVDTSNRGKVYQTMAVVVGQMYEVSIETLGDILNLRIGSSEQGSELLLYNSLPVGSHTFTVNATTTLLSIYAEDTGVSQIDNVSIKAVQNLVENGEFSSDRAFTKGTGWAISGGIASCDGTQVAVSQLVQTATGLIVGNTYKVSYDLTAQSAGSVRVRIGGAFYSGYVSVVGSYTYTFTLDSNQVVYIQADVDFIGSVDNVTVELLGVPDRSYNNNPLQVVGQLEKTAVASGAELVAYSGFSAVDYIEQPYNADLDFGTGDFCIMGWIRKDAITSDARILDLWQTDLSNSANKIDILYRFPEETLAAQVGVGSLLEIDFADSIDTWQFLCIRRSVTTLYMSLNAGTEVESYNDQTVGGVATFSLFLGTTANLTGTWAGELSLFRIGATTPSTDQILEIYNDEKKMFAVDSEITLSETQVQCHSYDKDSNTIKAGVTDGASSHFVDTFQDAIKISSEAVTMAPVSVDHTANSSAVAEATQVAYLKDAVDLKELG